MSSKINITKVSGKTTPKGTTPPTAKTAASAKATGTAKATATGTAKTTGTAKATATGTANAPGKATGTPKTSKILPPIPTLQTKKIKGQEDVNPEDLTGDDGEKVFKKVKKINEDSEVNEENEDSEVNKESDVKTGPDSIDSILKNTETIVEKVSDLVLKLIKFIKKSLQIKELKKVFFMIFMAIAMAILFMGLNILFGKVIL